MTSPAEQYKPKVGDRVRVTMEGHVDAVEDDLLTLDGRHIWRHDFTFEKLQDPEPVWVNGDVVQFTGDPSYQPIYHLIGGEWIEISGIRCGETPSDWWPNHMKILYKADQPDGVRAIACTPNNDY